MNEPVIVIPVDEVLDRFQHGDRWIQNDWSTEDGDCLHQGIRACQPQPGDAFLIEQVAARQGWGTGWNDEKGRTFDDIKACLVEHREIFPDELEATFGPQWQPIVRLVRQAATLTDRQVLELDAARAAAWAVARDAARVAARVAAWAAAGDAAGDAARLAAGVAARLAAGAAARVAAWALAVADLVGQHGLEQAHIDVLLAPWISVMGDPREVNDE